MAKFRKQRESTKPLVNPPRGIKRWGFRIAALMLPLALLLGLELILRAVGYGYPTSFLMQMETSGQQRLIQNDRFGWRFFGQEYARCPETFAFNPTVPSDTVRIFVLGGSAAAGDPQPAFGLPIMLDAMLSLRYPSTNFEVINVAMTAINSHVVREIAEDCSDVDADIWVIYMGNNEVVGPFGAGTVFGSQVPPMAAIRANLAIKSTRTGQLLTAMLGRFRSSKIEGDSWGGMEMFLDQQVSVDDPRMDRVYDHFQSNLEDIIDYGLQSGAGLVVCNQAVNLKDCAPFGSQSISLQGQQAEDWNRYLQHGDDLKKQGKWADALAAYEEAEQLDDQVADLFFRKGQCALAQGNTAQALSNFRRARDLDTLRFRFDSQLHDIIASVVEHKKSEQIRFADVEAAFIDASPDHIPGRELFYEHVHPNWKGNWLLAKTIADQVLELLPNEVKNSEDAQKEWPSAEQCGDRLVWNDRTHLEALNLVLGRLQKPPFTSQFNHEDQVVYLENQISRIGKKRVQQGTEQPLVELAVQSEPDNSYLLCRLAKLRFDEGDVTGAINIARRVTYLYPHAPNAWDQLANFYLRSGQMNEALECYERGAALESTDVWISHHLAEAYVKADQPEAALEQWNRVLKTKPMFGVAHLGMGQVLETQGKIEKANEHYKKAIQGRFYEIEGLVLLGQICLKNGWNKEALKGFQYAAELSPSNPDLHHKLSVVLKKLGRDEASEEQLQLAYQYGYVDWKERFNAGLEWANQGNMKAAEKEFRAVIELNPEMMEAHLNLGGALLEQGLTEEAADEFTQALRLDPFNKELRDFLQSIGFQLENTEP